MINAAGGWFDHILTKLMAVFCIFCIKHKFWDKSGQLLGRAEQSSTLIESILLGQFGICFSVQLEAVPSEG